MLANCASRALETYLKNSPSDNGSEFAATALKDWLCALGVKTSHIAPDSPWENGYNESFNGRLRDDLLRCESFYSMREADVLIESWRRHCNDIRPHSVLGHLSPSAYARALDHPLCATLQVSDPGRGEGTTSVAIGI